MCENIETSYQALPELTDYPPIDIEQLDALICPNCKTKPTTFDDELDIEFDDYKECTIIYCYNCISTNLSKEEENSWEENQKPVFSYRPDKLVKQQDIERHILNCKLNHFVKHLNKNLSNTKYDPIINDFLDFFDISLE